MTIHHQSELFNKEGCFDPSFRANDHDTSIDASANAGKMARGKRLLVLRILRMNGGHTDHELAEVTGMQHNSIGKRRSECYQLGLVKKETSDGMVVKRPAPSGSSMIVWTITQLGREIFDKTQLD